MKKFLVAMLLVVTSTTAAQAGLKVVGKGDAMRHVAFRIVDLVEETEGRDDLRIGIGEKGKGDLSASREVPQDLDRVVAQRGDPEPALLEVLNLALQLHELDLAERSPVGGTEEHEDEALRALERREASQRAGLVPGIEGGQHLPDLRADFHGIGSRGRRRLG